MASKPEPGGGSAAPPLVRDIYGATSDSRVRRSMLLGALLEGGSFSGPWNTGDHGTSGGPFQIHWTVHPDVVATAQQRGVTPEQLVNDPAYAVKYMLPAYSSAAAQVGADVWAGNPELAAERTAYLAERPAKDYYDTRGRAGVHNLYTQAAAVTADGGVGGAAPVAPATAGSSAGGSSPGKSKTGVVHVHIPIPWAPDINFDVPWLRMLLAVLGLALIVAGVKIVVIMAASPNPPSEPSTTKAKPKPEPVPA